MLSEPTTVIPAGAEAASPGMAPPAGGAKSGERRELISFRIGTQDFCVDIMAVREIRGWTPATPLPHAPDYIRGVINLRGAVLPIVDLSARFGLGTTEPTARHVIIVTNIGERVVGLQVDAVSDILTATEELVQPTPDVASEMAKTFIRGILAMGERMLSLISLERVLPQPEADAA